MEPFIERMLERAKTKKILKEQFHAGHNIRERWNLLTNTNVLKQTEGKKRISVDKPDDSLKSKKMEADVDLFKNPDSFSKSNDDKISNTLEKIKKSTHFTSNSQLSSKTELKNSETLIQLSGLVSNKILLFETKNMDTKPKVSTQPSFLERRAVFERNKEETVLIKPKTRFKRSTLFEKSQETNNSNTNLSEIKVAESNTYSTKYIDNADEESTTATLDQKIKTEMKDNHYIENNGIDQENDSESVANTSFEDSIMHVFDELLLSDKLKDSAESNSTIQEYLMLNETDQSLDEHLNAKELCDYDERETESLWLEINTNSGSPTESNQDESERDVLEEEIKKLLDEIYMQEKKIEGASKALNFIQSTDEFNDSTEQVAGEWALLVATHKRKAALNEVQRLKQKDTLRDLLEMQGCGSLTISDITLPLNKEYFQKMNTKNLHLYCICLMSYLGEVVATQAATAEPGDSCLRFTSVLKLENVYCNFRIDVKVYYFQTKPKCLSHNEKYHINRNSKAKNKSLKKKNRFIIPESLTGQNTIRSSVFQLMGTTTIKLNNINCKQFNLLGISSHLPLGHLNMHILSKPSESVEHHGFLTLFEDIANLGNWRRRWYRLRNARLDYWLNPDDEHEKDPIGYLDLEDVFTKNVQFVNREKCARPFTFLLETSRPAQPGDADSLIMKTNGIETTTEYFLLADTKEEALQWIRKLNKTLSLIRTWGPFRD